MWCKLTAIAASVVLFVIIFWAVSRPEDSSILPGNVTVDEPVKLSETVPETNDNELQPPEKENPTLEMVDFYLSESASDANEAIEQNYANGSHVYVVRAYGTI